MIKKLLVLVVFGFLSSGVVFAQGSGPTDPAKDRIEVIKAEENRLDCANASTPGILQQCFDLKSEREKLEAEVRSANEEKAKAANAAESKALAEAQKRLQGFSSTFDISNLSVGNEKDLTVGGANNEPTNILARMINVMGRLFGTIAVLMFVIGAFFMITSQGDDNRLQKGKTIFLYTIIGLLIGFTAYMMVQFVINIMFQT